MICNFFIMPITRDILLPITFTWVSQFNFVFIWRPRKLNSEVDWILLLFICKFSFGSWVFLCLLNNIYLDLFTFNVNLFADNHRCTLFNLLFKTSSLFTLSISSRQHYKVVSSAYIRKLNKLLELGISFIYIKNKSSPSMDPFGTPLSMAFISEVLSSNCTNCLRSSK